MKKLIITESPTQEDLQTADTLILIDGDWFAYVKTPSCYHFKTGRSYHMIWLDNHVRYHLERSQMESLACC